MFSLLKQKNCPHKKRKEDAYAAYARVLEQARAPQFYEAFGVPDSFDGRFEVLLVHVFMILHVVTGQGQAEQDFNQALFDAVFADMDQTLREMGIGDVGVPKHMRRMMKAFNGRMHAYDGCIDDDEAFVSALIRNVYGTVEQPDMEKLRQMKAYICKTVAVLRAQDVAEILGGQPVFTKFEG